MIASRHLAVGLVLTVFMGTADAHGPRQPTARVVGVQPIYETVIVETPLTTCYSDVVGRSIAARRVAGATLAVAIVREPVERCRTEIRRHTETRITGYWVDYRHRGRIHRVRSPYDPGPEIRVARS